MDSSAIFDEIKERMRILGIEHYNVLSLMNSNRIGDKLDYSDVNKLTNDICDFECKNNCIVYTVIYNKYEEIGNHLTLLYVSYGNKDEWQAEKEALKAMEPIAYVMNLTYPELSEYGTVLLRSHDGVLERIG